MIENLIDGLIILGGIGEVLVLRDYDIEEMVRFIR